MKTNFRSSVQILPRSVFLLNPLGLLWARFLYKFLKNLNTKQGRISLPSILQLLFVNTASACNTVMEKCQHSIKAAFKRVKSQIQKGAEPERATRCGYENACDYLRLHILQRELYTMGNTGLLRRKAEMTLLQPHLGDSRTEEFAFLACSSVRVTVSQGWRRLPP